MKISNILLVFLCIIFLSTLASSELYHAQNQNLTFSITSNFASQCVLTTIDTPNATKIINENGTLISTNTFSFFILYTNYSYIGDYKHNIVCYDNTTKIGNYLTYIVTPNGESRSTQVISFQIFLILFFIICGIAFYILKSKIDCDNWNKKFIKQYENKNWIKLSLGAIAYQFIKNSFIVYYLIFLPIILILNGIIISFAITYLITLFNVLFLLYMIGLIIVGLIFFSYIQEWIVTLWENISDSDWGLNGK